jgi:TDG/mug DNA glycosylase family protein
MAILPDFLRPNLTVVFCGTAAGLKSAERSHYYAGRGNEFWNFLFQGGFTSTRLQPADDSRILEFNLGLTDLAKLVAASSDAGLAEHYDFDTFVQKIQRYQPRWIAFHGKEAAGAVARHLGIPGKIRLGPQSWKIGSTAVFVLPSASGANRNAKRLEGKADRAEWFKELALLALSGL